MPLILPTLSLLPDFFSKGTVYNITVLRSLDSVQICEQNLINFIYFFKFRAREIEKKPSNMKFLFFVFGVCFCLWGKDEWIGEGRVEGGQGGFRWREYLKIIY